MAFVEGDGKILYIQRADNDDDLYPVGCLTSNSISESSDLLPTTTRDGGGWETSIPNSQSYTVSFEAISDTTTTNRAILKDIRDLKRSKTKIVWAIIDFDNDQLDYGEGYISGLDESMPANDLVSFSGQIVGYGQPYNDLPTPTITNVAAVDIGLGNVAVTITFTSSADVNIHHRFSWTTGVGVAVFRSPFEEVDEAPGATTASVINTTLTTSGYTIRFQLTDTWRGPVSNTST